MAGLCMIVNVIIESENKQIPHVSKQQKKPKKQKKQTCTIYYQQ